MQAAADELLSLGVDGLQLTPGNAPTEGFVENLRQRGVALRTHHGFTTKALRRQVWSAQAECLVDSHSVHPPRDMDAAQGPWRIRVEAGDFQRLTLETMYPGYCLGTGEALDGAMSLQLRLAVDVSHLHLQKAAGQLSEATWRRLQDYEHIDEVHVSANLGDRDAHLPVSQDTFGMAWAREKGAAGTPLILESYMHRLPETARLRQVDLLRGTT